MKKPKIKIWHVDPGYTSDLKHGVEIQCGNTPLGWAGGFTSKKAAREWAKDWCRTTGEALMKAGGCDFVMGLRKGQKAEKGK